MEKRVINPWQWQNERSYAQAIEVKNATSTLYCSGQAAVSAEGVSSTGKMSVQLKEAIQNLEKVIQEAGYRCHQIVKLNIYTVSSEEFMMCFGLLQDWLIKHHIQQTSSVIEVKGLFETLSIELEATLVR